MEGPRARWKNARSSAARDFDGGQRRAGRLTWLALLLKFTAPLLAQSGDWVCLSSPHFAVITDETPARSEPLLLELEVFRSTVSRYLGLPNEQRSQVNVYLFANPERFEAFRPAAESKTKGLGGYQATDGFRQVLAIRLGSDPATSRAILFHEYTHLLTSRVFRPVPLWLNEGLAEVFSTFTVANRQFHFGGRLDHRLAALASDGPLSPAELLGVRRESASYQHGREVPRFYASAWLLTQTLVITPAGFNATGLRNYVALSGSRTNREEAFVQAFGLSLGEATARTRTVLARRQFPTLNQPFDGAQISAPTLAPLSPAETTLRLGELARLAELHEQAADLLRAAQSELPRDPRPLEQLAFLAEARGQSEEALDWVNQALALGSRSCQAYFLAASLRWNRRVGQRLGATELAEAGRDIRPLLDRAIQLDRFQPRCHALLAYLLLQLSPEHPQAAEAAAREALQWDAFYYPARLALAEALAAEGQRGEATRVVAGLLGSPIEADLRREIRHFVARAHLPVPEAPNQSPEIPR